MQHPTCTRLRVRTPQDAQVIFHAVSLNILPMVTRRLDTEERRAISSGCIFVWEERGPNAEATGLGIERWTDGKRWGPSRVRDEFLFYHEKDPEPVDVELTSDSDSIHQRSHPGPSRGHTRSSLVKQTYSVFVETPRGRRKWHLIAYFTHDTVEYLPSVDNVPELARLSVPTGMYRSARQHHPPRRRDNESYSIRGPHGSPVFADRFGRMLTSNAVLAPLAYLQNIPPPRRHPLDEEALMSFYPGLA
ncbi:hypothetical protein SERLA73DRAFT_180841 [Serpula lacrymans var. lacrymans S7.3]|uniref:Gti1/Pac2 family-domain-containing protein n=1 Tax=Serpula lacrymans var. lacrymans (strain S7.3) TaxID=936435 RepID=F8PWJ4_SERL3|nr:hypothetical protein SERLA73DRAFT_180841 [Serpula lacrymans var. lacrymans S7.3]